MMRLVREVREAPIPHSMQRMVRAAVAAVQETHQQEQARLVVQVACTAAAVAGFLMTLVPQAVRALKESSSLRIRRVL